jgi:hypothetical protein
MEYVNEKNYFFLKKIRALIRLGDMVGHFSVVWSNFEAKYVKNVAEKENPC